MDLFSLRIGAGLLLEIVLILFVGRIVRRRFLESASYERFSRIIAESIGIVWIVAITSYALRLIFVQTNFAALVDTATNVIVTAMTIVAIGLLFIVVTVTKNRVRT